MRPTRIRVLGRLHIDQADGSVALAQRAGVLLAYLAVHVGRAHRREMLAETLWPDCSPAYSRAYLRRALWQARRALDLGENDGVLSSDTEWIELRPSPLVSIDAVEFAAAFHTLSTAAGADRPSLLHRCISATELYRGDLLEDCADDWCLVPRERYRSLHVTMLEWIIEQILDRDHLLAETFCQRLLEVDSAHEWAHRALMWVLWAAGDRTRALRQFEVCREHLTRELNVKPALATTELRDRIALDQQVSRAAALRGSASGRLPLRDGSPF
jgi:DNA-binding SARP family transcriptional activator